ncbi:phage portal protein [Shewanella glacialipiscicola]|uniref:phage portal protein n=1 Tax=Shewanella glacialipiscicola TaxID=614069 RepID=UPI003D7AF33F
MNKTASKGPERKTRSVQGSHKRYALAAQGLKGPRLGGLTLSINEELRRDLGAIKAQSRRAGNDDGYVVKFLAMCETHVVGPEGFSFQSKAQIFTGNADDTAANDLIEEHFKDWGKKGCCDVTGRFSWQDLQMLFIRTVAEDGEILVRLVEGFPNKYGFALQLLDSAHLDINYNRELKDGRRIRMGVEVDEWDKPVAYHILTQHPGDRVYFYGNARYERIPASEMLLEFLPLRVGQLRGVPWAHAALLEMHHLHGYREAELTGARIAASKMIAYEPDSDVEPEDDTEEPDFVEEVEPGMSVVVPYGYSLKELNFNQSGSNFASYMKEGKRGAASGLDVSYNTLANDGEGISFSSLRQFVLEDRDGWKKKQRWMRQAFCDVVKSTWLRMSLLTGAIKGLRFSELERLDKHCFQGRRWDWVDPLKDEKANTEAINNMTKSPFQIIRERGDDPETVIKELIEFEDRIAEVRKARAAALQQQGNQDVSKEKEQNS